MKHIIELENIVKKFKGVYAINGLDLNIDRGDVFGLLGHNGAGKTTILRIILGLYKADYGRVQIYGKDPIRDGNELRQQMGVLSEDVGLYESLTVYENLVFFAKIFKMNKTEYDKKIEYLLNEFEIFDKKDFAISGFSTGMKKKVALIRTFLHDPRLILLDEPTNALDPVSIDKLHKIIKEMSDRYETTFIITTHNLDEVSKICSKISIIKQGKNILTQNLKETEQFDKLFQTNIVCFGIVEPEFSQKIQKIFKTNLVNETYNTDGLTIKLKTSNANSIAKIVRILVENEIDVIEIKKDEFDLEKLYLQISQ